MSEKRAVDVEAIESMGLNTEETQDLFQYQVSRLAYGHFLALYWCTQSEGLGVKYNITNCFDDLKHGGITRTKQTAVAIVETLYVMGYVDIKDERNRKNIYITKWGAKALEHLVLSKKYQTVTSSFLEENQL